MSAPQQQQQQQQQPQQPQQQQQQQQEQQSRQQVTINDALNTLCGMFESVDRDVVHMILIEGCGGNMEAAVEALLTMTGGISQNAVREAPKMAKIENNVSNNNASSGSSVNLPDDFLRPPSYFLSLYENESSHKMNVSSEKERQIIEDEMFAKAVFEDSLFTADLHANPEWVLEEINNNKKQSRFNKFSFHQNQNENTNIDPSDINARKISFKQRFNTLSSAAKQKLGILAQKLQRNKQESKKNSHSHQYKNVLTSLDDEPLVDVDDNNNSIIGDATELNRGTYQAPMVLPPKKPKQDL